MLNLSIWVGLLILHGILAEDIMQHGGLHHYISQTDQASQTARFGFPALDELRRNFCISLCTSADTMPYFINLLCAAKCPELYLPHHMTTERITSASIIPTTASTNASIMTTQLPTTSISPGQISNETSSSGVNSTTTL